MSSMTQEIVKFTNLRYGGTLINHNERPALSMSLSGGKELWRFEQRSGDAYAIVSHDSSDNLVIKISPNERQDYMMDLVLEQMAGTEEELWRFLAASDASNR